MDHSSFKVEGGKLL